MKARNTEIHFKTAGRKVFSMKFEPHFSSVASNKDLELKENSEKPM